ncbi:MAG TPA: SDR family NAD(P)-dependent oxidoreductase, partial [Gemmatimonadaceae bacterium]|nr:SDR family NAD(P)-dependent oxidoreductase [Gemmatimonadaceae bacterium]
MPMPRSWTILAALVALGHVALGQVATDRMSSAASAASTSPAAPRMSVAPFAQKAVLVTGATSGIGKMITERLAANGFFVYAGARTDAEMKAMNAIPNVQAVRLDVTRPGDIASAVATVTSAGRGLWGVVNNAGVVIVAPLIEADEKDMNFIFNVNLYGPYRITKAFAPLLLESKGRVVNISSLNGIVASPMIGAYSMSKHAIEAYGDGLAAELGRFGVRVSLIEPGNYGTEIGKSMLARMDTSVIAGSRFERQMRSAVRSIGGFETNPPPDAVADAALDALQNTNPRHRYLVVPDASQAAIPIRKLIDEVVELNDSQKFKY